MIDFILQLTGKVFRQVVIFFNKRYQYPNVGYNRLRPFLILAQALFLINLVMLYITYHLFPELFKIAFVISTFTTYLCTAIYFSQYKVARFKEYPTEIRGIFARSFEEISPNAELFISNFLIFDCQKEDHDGAKIRYTEVIIPRGSSFEKELEASKNYLTPFLSN